MNWYQRLPKVELHVHLEGAIPHPALWALIEKYGGNDEVPTEESLIEKFQFKDFPHFIDTWLWKSQFLREYEDFTFIAEAFAQSLVVQNIVYAEAHYVPGEHCAQASHLTRFPKNLQEEKITEALLIGLNKVPEVRVNLILDMCRDLDPKDGELTVHKIKAFKDNGVVGIGLGGSEHLHPPELFKQAFNIAKDAGLRTTAHAGEAAGPASVRGAIDQLGVERIGHGTLAVEDPDLLADLKERQIVIEMCPISNVRTKVINDLSQHPIRKFFDAGLHVTVNTDDPSLFNNSLAEELESLKTVHGFSEAEICRVIKNGITGSWLGETEQKAMIDQFAKHPDWIV